MDPSGASYKVLYRFVPFQDGEFPATALLDLKKGTLYGATSEGGKRSVLLHVSGLVGCRYSVQSEPFIG